MLTIRPATPERKRLNLFQNLIYLTIAPSGFFGFFTMYMPPYENDSPESFANYYFTRNLFLGHVILGLVCVWLSNRQYDAGNAKKAQWIAAIPLLLFIPVLIAVIFTMANSGS